MSRRFSMVWTVSKWHQFVKDSIAQGPLCTLHRPVLSTTFELDHIPFECMLIPNYIPQNRCQCELQADGTYRSSAESTLRTGFFVGLKDPTAFPDDIEIQLDYTVSIQNRCTTEWYQCPFLCSASLTQTRSDWGYSNFDTASKYKDRLMDIYDLRLRVDIDLLSSNLEDVDY